MLAEPLARCASSWRLRPNRGLLGAIARGLTTHGLRHTHKTRMRELGTPPKLMDERMGHEDGSVQSRYDHITPEMRVRLMEGLTAEWEVALDARLAMSPRSPVVALDELRKARA
ncbi:tyrosine-type recombinase/integrase [Actinosynnema sp. ALI-1.44]|uniref:tyrosine-type recombinase/integrase n=1 Tax=Actinosynnema sp. ALI-1.44 TaxID=1933779 RepID=UPI0022A98476|nr:tyrosine-type recombinase/integrase [Actinosynnema sp. ALI-1.44]